MSWILGIGGAQNSRQCCPVLAAGGTCWKQGCKFSHNKEDAPICRRWQEGGCIGGRGNNCQLRHYYNETDNVVSQAKRFQESEGLPSSSENIDFSSPYRVKVVKEVEKQRMEEVDLDTGKRRSWVETKEYEVYDLTGATPAKPKAPLMDKTNTRNLISNLAKSNMLADSADNPVTSTPIARKVVSVVTQENDRSDEQNTVDDNTCPVCMKKFKGARGVKTHRSSRNSNCKVGKENLENGSVTPIKALSSKELAGSGRPQSTVTSEPQSSDSVIVISDTPEVPVSRRRSVRLQPVS